MLDFFKEMTDDYDIIFFLPHETIEDRIEIRTRNFANPGELVGGNDMGKEWHIVLFTVDDEGFAKDVDAFDAILGDPREYVSTLLPLNFFGAVAKKTTTSKAFVDDFVDNLKSM